MRNQISAILGMNIVDRHDKYLGMPAVVGRSKHEVFAYLRDRIWRRIQGWGERTLSSAGKEVLIKAVLQSIPTYIMSCFLLPATLSTPSKQRSDPFGGGTETTRTCHGYHGRSSAGLRRGVGLILGTFGLSI